MKSTTIQIEVTIRGETRSVEFTAWVDENGNTDPNWSANSKGAVGLFTKGYGNKVWAHYLTAWPKKDGSGWRVSENATILNRNGYRLIDWADRKVSESAKSRHNSAY